MTHGTLGPGQRHYGLGNNANLEPEGTRCGEGIPRRLAPPRLGSYGAVERRYGLVVGVILGTAIAALQAVTAGGVNLPRAVLAIVGGVVLFLVGTYVVALWQTPARLAWEAANTDDPNSDTLTSVGVNPVDDHGPLILAFVTRSRSGDLLMPLWPGPKNTLRRVRFFEPSELVIEPNDVPATLRVGRRGRVVIKRIGNDKMLMECVRTDGVMCKAELYYDREHGNHRG